MKSLDSKPTSKEDIRRNNLSALLRHVHSERTISRAALGEVLGLSKTTVAELVADLESRGLVVRRGQEQSGSAGRPSHLIAASSEPIVLVINPEIDGLNLALINFAAEILDSVYLELDEAYSVETAIALVRHSLETQWGAYEEILYGAVLAVPGAIDHETLKLIYAPSLGWRDIEVGSVFSAALGMRVWVTNNARAATISEHTFGAAKGLSNAICLFSGVGGIGGGFVVNGHVLDGSSGLAGEIGKMRLYAEGAKKHSTFGELMHREDLVAALGQARLSDVQIDELLVTTSDPKVHQCIDSQVAVLISAIETLRDLLDPQVIVLGGYLGSLVKARKQQITNTLNSTSLKFRSEDFLVTRAAELRPMVLLGAAELAWSELLVNPLNYRRKKGRKHV